MFKLKQILLVATLVGGFAIVATASILGDFGMQERRFSVAAQIDTLDLTAKAGHLPIETTGEPF